MERGGPGSLFRENRFSTLKAASLSYQAKGLLDFFFRWGAITADRSNDDGDRTATTTTGASGGWNGWRRKRGEGGKAGT